MIEEGKDYEQARGGENKLDDDKDKNKGNVKDKDKAVA